MSGIKLKDVSWLNCLVRSYNRYVPDYYNVKHVYGYRILRTWTCARWLLLFLRIYSRIAQGTGFGFPSLLSITFTSDLKVREILKYKMIIGCTSFALMRAYLLNACILILLK